ncbi:hypothetical protein CG709_07990, partial [Lachnotalea glycerini]
MKNGKVVSKLLAVVLSLFIVLTGCSANDTASRETGSEAVTENSSVTEADSDLLELEVYSVAANYQGEQSGWFAKIIQDKFNIKLNIIAPQVSGDGKALYQTRCASGDLGDIIILDNSDFQDCVQAGLIADITNELQTTTNLKTYTEQIKTYNSNLKGEDGTKLYGIPCNMTNTSPVSYTHCTLPTNRYFYFFCFFLFQKIKSFSFFFFFY